MQEQESHVHVLGVDGHDPRTYHAMTAAGVRLGAPKVIRTTVAGRLVDFHVVDGQGSDLDELDTERQLEEEHFDVGPDCGPDDE